LLGDLVDLVDIGALFAIDLDVDEAFVEELGGVFVFETLFCQIVAPRARQITYAEVNGLALVPRAFECLRSPRVPVDWIGSVLPQIRTRLSNGTVGVLRRAVAVQMSDFRQVHPLCRGLFPLFT